MKRTIIAYIFTCMILSAASAADKIKLEVNVGEFNRINCVVSVILPSDINNETVLYELIGKKKIKTESQLVKEQDGRSILYWILSETTQANTSRTFIIEKTKEKPTSNITMKAEDTQRALILKRNNKSILQYNYAITEAPQGVDPSYNRSGYIHPAYSPAGNILTTIQPKDHYHHYGIWNPWTRIWYDNSMYDLWNLGDKQGTVRAKNIDNIYNGQVFAGYNASLDHIIFTSSGEKTILNEQWQVKAWNISEGFLWDFKSHLYPSTSLPVTIKEYRYAGFGYRATEDWTKDNCIMYTSEGKNRPEIDGTTARWIYITGETASGKSGLLFMAHPSNYNSPEPLRIWNEKANGRRGDAFINFAPTKNMDWVLKPNNHYLLQYRVMSYEGEMSNNRADELWNDFAHPPVVKIIN